MENFSDGAPVNIQERSAQRTSPTGLYLALGIILGLCLGVLVGILTSSIVIGAGMGLALGVGLGMGLDQWHVYRNKRREIFDEE